MMFSMGVMLTTIESLKYNCKLEKNLKACGFNLKTEMVKLKLIIEDSPAGLF